MIKIQDLAKACDCSIATVSKALNGKSDVSEKTAKRIREMAVQLHYLPFVSGQQLRTGHSFTIGVLLRRLNQGSGMDAYECEVLLHLKEALDQYGYALNLLPESAGDSSISIYERAFRRSYDGVILFSPDFNDPQIQELFEKKLPMVVLEAETDRAVCVSSDWQDSAYAVTSHLLSQGCEELILVCGAENRQTYSQTRGYMQAHWEENIHVDEAVILQAPTETELYKTIDSIHPDGILFTDASICRTALTAYKKMKRKDIRFGYCGGEIIPNVPDLVRYIHNTEKIAQEVARKLFLNIDLETPIPEHIVVQGDLDDNTEEFDSYLIRA